MPLSSPPLCARRCQARWSRSACVIKSGSGKSSGTNTPTTPHLPLEKLAVILTMWIILTTRSAYTLHQLYRDIEMHDCYSSQIHVFVFLFTPIPLLSYLPGSRVWILVVCNSTSSTLVLGEQVPTGCCFSQSKFTVEHMGALHCALFPNPTSSRLLQKNDTWPLTPTQLLI